MTTFNESKTRMRRFLRDPGPLPLIWDDDQILVYFNDAQIEVASKIGFIERVHAYPYPPRYTFSYMKEWERQHTFGDRYQCLMLWPIENQTMCYPWEAGYTLGDLIAQDEGYRFIHPWEVGYCNPADVIKIPLHAKWHNMKFLAFDEERIDPMPEREIARTDGYYKTRNGEPMSYYHTDEYNNEIVLYPRPSSITWDDVTWLSEAASDTFSDVSGEGIITWWEDSFDETDTGMILDAITMADNVFMIFEAIPEEVPSTSSDWDDEITWWPPYMIQVIEYATLERCFGADNEGFIPSLRDYWQTRKNIGIEAIKQFMYSRSRDRDYRMGGNRFPERSSHPRLPSEYPVQWP